MFKFPLIIVYMIIAFNLTVFTLALQFDLLIFKHIAAKIIFWMLTVGAWWLSYVNRNKFFKIS